MITGTVTIKWDADTLRKSIRKKVATKMDRAAHGLTTLVRETLNNSNQGGMFASPPGAPPHSGTRGLVNSIQWARDGDMARVVGSSLPYALVHEVGGAIHPAAASALAVPISAQAKRHSQKGGGPRTFRAGGKRGLTRIPRPGRGPLLVEKVGGKNSRSIIHYVLMDEVVLLPRPYLRPALYSTEFREILRGLFGA